MVWMAWWWLSEPLPLPVTSLIPVLVFPLLGVASLLFLVSFLTSIVAGLQVSTERDSGALRLVTRNEISLTVNLPAPANLGSVSLPPGGPFQLKLTGTAAAYYEIQSNTTLNFTNWTTVAFITNSGGMTVFNDPSATNRPQTFYRAIAR